jgi:hypothetical protein
MKTFQLILVGSHVESVEIATCGYLLKGTSFEPGGVRWGSLVSEITGVSVFESALLVCRKVNNMRILMSGCLCRSAKTTTKQKMVMVG